MDTPPKKNGRETAKRKTQHNPSIADYTETQVPIIDTPKRQVNLPIIWIVYEKFTKMSNKDKLNDAIS